MSTLFKCVRFICFVRSDGLLNALEQSGYSQGYGFSPKGRINLFPEIQEKEKKSLNDLYEIVHVNVDIRLV